jgi:hypothetical protein
LARTRHRRKGNFRFRFRHRSKTTGSPKDDVLASVEPTAKELRRLRRQMAWTAAKCAGITAAGVWLFSGSMRLWREGFTTHPDFAVGHFALTSNVPAERGGVTRDLVLAATGLREDTNVMDVDLESVRRALERLPQIKAARVERVFPNLIEIHVEERRPVAWLACGPKDIQPRDSVKGRLLDESGAVFECRSLVNPYNRLPVINVPTLDWVESGRPLADRRALRAVELIAILEQKRWPVPMSLVQIDVLNDYSLIAHFSDHAQATFPMEDLDRQAGRLAEICRFSANKGRSVETVNLIPQKNIPVTYFPVSGEEEGAEAAQLPGARRSTVPAPAARGRAVPAAHRSEPREGEQAAIQAILRGT